MLGGLCFFQKGRDPSLESTLMEAEQNRPPDGPVQTGQPVLLGSDAVISDPTAAGRQGP